MRCEKVTRMWGWSAAMGLLVLSTSLATAQSPPLSVDDVIQKLEQWQERILSQPSLYFEYEQERQYFLNGQEDEKVIKAHIVNAQSDGMHYLSHDEPGEVSSWCSWKDGVTTYRVQEALFIQPDPHPNFWDQAYFAHGIFLDVHQGLVTTNSSIRELIQAVSFSEASPLVLPRSVKRVARQWRVLDQTEMIEGAECVVLQRDKRDKIWLDIDHTYVCRKRIYANPDGTPLLEVKNSKLREYKSGIWLPSDQLVSWYRPQSDPPETRGKLFRQDRNLIVKVSFSKLPPSFFDIPIPAQNGYVIDEVRGVHYGLASVGATAEGMVAKALKNTRAVLAEKRKNQRALLMTGIAVAAIGLILTSVAYRVITRRKRQSE